LGEACVYTRSLYKAAHMTISTRINLLLGLSWAFVLASSAQACGDKVAALGGGVPFQQVMAHHSPGRVVVFMNSSAADGDAQIGLVRALERAGHHVSVVRSETELVGVLQSGPADVVLADIDTIAPSARTALAAACVVDPANRRTGSLVHVVDDIIARRNATGGYACAASGHPGI
jgi:hypothetical protein